MPEVTLIDTNVLLDLATDDPDWSTWSLRQLETAAARGALLISDIVYAELSVGFERIEEVDAFLEGAALEMVPVPHAALFLAGKTFRRYRAQGGTRTGVLPDFFVGAHAAVAELPLLTRDVTRYRTYFPTVILITPSAS
jgi:predicted nucleic acid-binding protein